MSKVVKYAISNSNGCLKASSVLFLSSLLLGCSVVAGPKILDKPVADGYKCADVTVVKTSAGKNKYIVKINASYILTNRSVNGTQHVSWDGEKGSLYGWMTGLASFLGLSLANPPSEENNYNEYDVIIPGSIGMGLVGFLVGGLEGAGDKPITEILPDVEGKGVIRIKGNISGVDDLANKQISKTFQDNLETWSVLLNKGVYKIKGEIYATDPEFNGLIKCDFEKAVSL